MTVRISKETKVQSVVCRPRSFQRNFQISLQVTINGIVEFDFHLYAPVGQGSPLVFIRQRHATNSNEEHDLVRSIFVSNGVGKLCRQVLKVDRDGQYHPVGVHVPLHFVHVILGQHDGRCIRRYSRQVQVRCLPNSRYGYPVDQSGSGLGCRSRGLRERTLLTCRDFSRLFANRARTLPVRDALGIGGLIGRHERRRFA